MTAAPLTLFGTCGSLANLVPLSPMTSCGTCAEFAPLKLNCLECVNVSRHYQFDRRGEKTTEGALLDSVVNLVGISILVQTYSVEWCVTQ